MRWLVFFLVVLNGLTFAWFSFQRQQAEQLVQQEEHNSQFDFSSTATVHLLTELSEQERHNRDLRRVIKPLAAVPVDLVEPQQDIAEVVDQDNNDDCALIGSYPEVISARQARLTLMEAGIDAKVVLIVKKLPAVSWVYLPPAASRKEALSTLKQLQDRNVDSFLVAEGEYENAISLGFFSNNESAEAVIRQRKEQGYDARVTMRERERKSYWVALSAGARRVDDALLNRLSQQQQPVVKKQEISCEEVALFEAIL